MREKDEGRSRKDEISARRWSLDASGTLDVGLAAVNRQFNELLNSPAERSKSGGRLRKS